ncbi:MAG: tautomerase family protein [Methyloligellaceae bacterium]
MPIIRVDIPEGHDRDTKDALYSVLHDAIAETWAKEHIWIALREKYSPPGNTQVVMTVDLRPGRGGEAERLRALFDQVQSEFERLIGTSKKDLIVLIRDFPDEACLSEGEPLPSLESLAPAVG